MPGSDPLRLRVRARMRAIRRLFRQVWEDKSPEARARRLLCEWLSRDQLDQLKQHGHFDVVGCDTGARYRIYYGSAGNIVELGETGERITGWCFVPGSSLPTGDVVLAQKIALETNERAALKVANKITPAYITSGAINQRSRPAAAFHV